jgi:3-phenylpropionate/cinnamic acid dioxygenase small subunit
VSLVDELAVCDVLYRFAEGIDLRDFELYRSVFTDEIEVDYSSHRRGSAGRMRADDWVERARRRFTALDATQHVMSNPRVTVDGDTAICSMYVVAHHHHHRLGSRADSYTLGGRYVDLLIRTGGRWRISRLALQVWWSQGNPALVGLSTATQPSLTTS